MSLIIITRRAGATWLLCIIQRVGAHRAAQEALSQVQEIFSDLLADPNEEVQEIASRGLVAVHEHGDDDSKAKLVKSLVSTLSGGTRGQKKGRAGNTVFSGGAIAKSGITTYQYEYSTFYDCV